MKPSKRILIAGVVIQLLLAGIGYFLLAQLASGYLKPTNTVAETAATVTSTLGGLMGALAGVLIVAYIVLRRRGL